VRESRKGRWSWSAHEYAGGRWRAGAVSPVAREAGRPRLTREREESEGQGDYNGDVVGGRR
jgi:hypothetical protein